MPENIHAIKWDWLTNKKYSIVLDEIRRMVEPGVLPSERREKISLVDGQISICNLPVPHEMLPYFFENTYSIKTLSSSKYSEKHPFSGTKYDLYIGNNLYSYVSHDDETIQFLKNGENHCTSGPAWISKDKTVKYHYLDGKLHNLNGAAERVGNKKTYAINGEKLSLLDFVLSNPKSERKTEIRGSEFYSIAYLKQHAALTGLDNTKALLKKTDESPNIDNFLLELIGNPMPGFRVINYSNISSRLQPLYEFIKNSGPWDYDTNKFETRISLHHTGTYLAFNKETKVLVFNSNEFESHRRMEFDLSFEGGIPNQFPNIYVKYDALGRKHNAEGPAIRYNTGHEDYYIHGTHVSRQEFESKIHDQTQNMYYWVNDKNRYHSPSTACPAIIHSDGSRKYYFDGLLHSDTFPAISIPGYDNRISEYYIYGNKITREEFGNYSWGNKTITFTDSNNLFHREGGPAIINFNIDGDTVSRYFQHGKLHRDNGPAIFDSKTQSGEFWENGIKSIDEELFEVEVKLKQKNPIARSDIKVVNLKGDTTMSIKTIKAGQAGSEVTDTRTQQLISGGKLGLKKGALKVTSAKVASALAGVIPMPEMVPKEKLVQLILLLGTAEIIDRLPDGMSSKVGFDSSKRAEFSGLARFISGETLGRDSVEIISGLAPILMDAIQKFSAAEITDLTNNYSPETVEHSQHVEEEHGVSSRR
jgi:hypothetical protein